MSEICEHTWRVKPSTMYFKTLEPKWPEKATGIAENASLFWADANFVQLECSLCGIKAAARNQLPIMGPEFASESSHV